VYLTWAIAVFLAFFPFSRINNFWRLNVVAGSIPTCASTKSPIKMRLFEGYCKSFPLEGFLPRFDPRAAVLLPNLNALVPDQTADAFQGNGPKQQDLGRTYRGTGVVPAILAVLNNFAR